MIAFACLVRLALQITPRFILFSLPSWSMCAPMSMANFCDEVGRNLCNRCSWSEQPTMLVLKLKLPSHFEWYGL